MKIVQDLMRASGNFKKGFHKKEVNGKVDDYYYKDDKILTIDYASKIIILNDYGKFSLPIIRTHALYFEHEEIQKLLNRGRKYKIKDNRVHKMPLQGHTSHIESF